MAAPTKRSSARKKPSVERPSYRELRSLGSTRISVDVPSDPWELPVDALVIPTGIEPTLDGGLAQALLEELPENTREHLEKTVREQRDTEYGPSKPLVVRTPSRLRKKISPKYLIFATAAFGSTATAENAAAAVRAICEQARMEGIRTIALPLLGSGRGGLDSTEVIQSMLGAIYTHDRLEGIDEITVLTLSSDAYREALSAFGTDDRPTSVKMVSDRPVESIDEDRLGFAPYARAIAGLINHDETSTPLTLAINARWGVGKSSLGNMVRRLLQTQARSGNRLPHRTVWFNAWLHDEAENLTPALIGQVAREADRNRPLWRKLIDPIPISLLPPSDRFARRLLDLFRLTVFAFVILVIGLRIADLVGLEYRPLASTVAGAVAKIVLGSEPSSEQVDTAAGGGILVILMMLLKLKDFVFGAAKSLAAFVSNPTRQAESGSLDKVRMQLGTLIAQGTPRGARFIIFIDDLERCRPPRPVDLLESINQLLNLPNVVTVIMADMRTIETCVEVKYEDLAKKHATQLFGRQYLEKIVQLQFDLPERQSEDRSRQLLKSLDDRSEETSEPTSTQRVFNFLRTSEMSFDFIWTEAQFVRGSLDVLIREYPRRRYLALVLWILAFPMYWFARYPVRVVYNRARRSQYPGPPRDVLDHKLQAPLTTFCFALQIPAYGSLIYVLSGLCYVGLQRLVALPRDLDPLEVEYFWRQFFVVLLPLSSPWVLMQGWLVGIAWLKRRQEARLATLLRERGDGGDTAADAEIDASLERFAKSKAGREIISERHFHQLAESSDALKDAEGVALKYVPRIPRRLKRNRNRLRVLLFVAHQRGMLTEDGFEDEAARIGKWAALVDCWPQIAQVILHRAAIVGELESCADRHEAFRGILQAAEVDVSDADRLREFCQHAPKLGAHIQRLLFFEPIPVMNMQQAGASATEYVGGQNSSVFHLRGCSMADRISPSNRRIFSAPPSGRNECSYCRPLSNS